MNDSARRYASGAVVVGTVLGAAYAFAPKEEGVYGVPFSYSGKQYYVKDGSRRVVYPSREACMQDVPVSMQNQCEPVSSYRGGAYGSRYYGPVYHPSDTNGMYHPAAGYPTEAASSSNVGKGSLPSSSSKYGFGATGKAHTSAKGGFGG